MKIRALVPPLPTVTHLPWYILTVLKYRLTWREAAVFRGSIVVPGRKRPLRHLVVARRSSADNTSDGKLPPDQRRPFVHRSSLVRHYGLPATPEWGPWMISQLQQQKCIQLLPAFGYAAVAVKAKRKELLALLRRGCAAIGSRFLPKMGRRMARNPAHQEHCLIPA